MFDDLLGPRRKVLHMPVNTDAKDEMPIVDEKLQEIDEEIELELTKNK